MSMDEQWARRVVLAQAIETADTQGTLVSQAEREQADRQVKAQADGAGQLVPNRLPELLHRRARLLLTTIEKRSTALASLQESRHWLHTLALAAPILSFVLGVLTDRIANPHRVDLLSMPLLVIVLWNVAMYLLLAAMFALSLRKSASPARGSRPPAFAALRRSMAGLREWRRRSGKLQAEVAARFYARWHMVTAALNAQRWRRVLHLCAAMWGAGVAVSLFTRGLVVEYRVGWESTFLNAQQVHAILSVLFAPVVALFSHAPFTVDEVARLRFGAGDGAVAGARWVTMYASLLVVLVVLPRLVLAGLAYRRERVLSRHVALDWREAYYQRLIAMLFPAQVQLAVAAAREGDKSALLRVLLQEPQKDAQQAAASEAAGVANSPAATAIRTTGGDTLLVVSLPEMVGHGTAPAAPGKRPRWLQNALQAVWSAKPAQGSTPGEAPSAREGSDVVLQIVRSAEELHAAAAHLLWLGKPVLVIFYLPGATAIEAQDGLAQCRLAAREISLVADVLAFDAFARCWIHDHILLEAIGRSVPMGKREGYARLAEAWQTRNLARLHDAMAALASHLMLAARQREEVQSPALSLKHLVSASEREAGERSSKAAMTAVVERLQQSEARTAAALRRLYGVNEAAAGVLAHRLEEKFVIQKAVNTPQAGMAGAATGAAMGASVDLLTGGLTLGAAAALGALVGGGAAFVAAAWKNRTTASGATVVQLSDDMLQAMVEAGLLRYVAVAGFGRDGGTVDGAPADEQPGEPRPFWKSEVVAAVQAQKDRLAPLWAAARSAPRDSSFAAEPPEELVQILEAVALKVLRGLYPAA
jgi:hypothetical protein